MENQKYSRVTNVSTRTENERNTFSPQDILHKSTNDPNGLFVMMLQNFAVSVGKSPYFGRNEAVRYHKNIGLGSEHNILPRLVTATEKHPTFCSIGIKIKTLLELFQSFHKEPSPLTYESSTQNIVILVQQIIALGEKIKPTINPTPPTIASSIEE